VPRCLSCLALHRPGLLHHPETAAVGSWLALVEDRLRSCKNGGHARPTDQGGLRRVKWVVDSLRPPAVAELRPPSMLALVPLERNEAPGISRRARVRPCLPRGCKHGCAPACLEDASHPPSFHLEARTKNSWLNSGTSERRTLASHGQ
jgi:hypothetical protein